MLESNVEPPGIGVRTCMQAVGRRQGERTLGESAARDRSNRRTVDRTRRICRRNGSDGCDEAQAGQRLLLIDREPGTWGEDAIERALMGKNNERVRLRSSGKAADQDARRRAVADRVLSDGRPVRIQTNERGCGDSSSARIVAVARPAVRSDDQADMVDGTARRTDEPGQGGRREVTGRQTLPPGRRDQPHAERQITDGAGRASSIPRRSWATGHCMARKAHCDSEDRKNGNGAEGTQHCKLLRDDVHQV